MGMMKGMTPELMWMPVMGWMDMSECHHCSMPLPKGENAWRASTLSAEGWTMQVRWALCARAMSLETKGESILRIPLETPDKTLVVFSDEQGNLFTSTPGVLCLEEPGSHAQCNQWSRAFSSRKAFDNCDRENPKYADAKLLTFAQWAQLQGDKPDTYEKPHGPSNNPCDHAKSGTHIMDNGQEMSAAEMPAEQTSEETSEETNQPAAENEAAPSVETPNAEPTEGEQTFEEETP